MVHRKNEPLSVDSNIVIDLVEVKRTDLLTNIWHGKMYSASSVLRLELQGYEPEIKTLGLKEFPINHPEGHFFIKKLFDIYGGLSFSDSETIAVAKFSKSFCATNDQLARKACSDHNIGIIGTIGILEINIKLNLITAKEGISILERSIKNGAHIKDVLANQFITKWSK